MTVDLITLVDPRSPAAEAYRTLRTNLMFSNVDAALRTFAVTAAAREDDKSFTLANLAVTLAQAEHPTLIVDADLRQPSQHKLWGLDNRRGLTTMLLDEAAMQQPPFQATAVNGLMLLPSGELPPNPADLLASKKMEQVIEKLLSVAEYVLFDLPPVLAAADAAVFSRKLDGVLLVAKAGTTKRDQITRAKDQLDRVGANLIGAVLTNAPRSRNSY